MVDRIPAAPKSASMKSFGPNECRLLRHELDQAIKSVAEKYGITLTIGKMGYTETNISMKLEVATIGENGLVLNRKASDFKALASLYGFQPDDLGKTFNLQGAEYRIVGLNQRASKSPVNIERTRDGKGFKVSEKTALRAMGRAVPDHLGGH